MKEQEFIRLGEQGYNLVPLIRKLDAEDHTPLSCYLDLAQGAYSYILESVQGARQWSRYSIIGLPCSTRVEVHGHRLRVLEQDVLSEEHSVEDPLVDLQRFLERFQVPRLIKELPFSGGLVGYFGYDTMRYTEARLAHSTPPDDLGFADIQLLVSRELLVFDREAQQLILLVHADPREDGAYAQAQERLEELCTRLANNRGARHPLLEVPLPEQVSLPEEEDVQRSIPQKEYEQIVDRIKEYIFAGDLMQVVPSQRCSLPFDAPPLLLYRALRHINPSPYLYYLHLNELHIIGSSPEILARLEGRTITMKPIAGTRPRGKTPEEDQQLQEELLSDPKELAEHLMLVDLGRNDTGRVSTIGSVKVRDTLHVEYYSHVMHIVSYITGTLLPDLSAFEVLRATLPAGTLSGAPKIRAMQIIDEMEPVKRGIYGGAVGYVAWHGDMDTAIAIRTILLHRQRLYIQAGGGIVADSEPHNEWLETLRKSGAMLKATAIAREAAARGLKAS